MHFDRCGLLAALAIVCAGAAEPRAVVVEVEAGRRPRQDTPVVLPLPVELKDARSFSLVGLDDRKPVAVQVVSSDPPVVAWMIRGLLAAGESRRYRLKPSSDPTDVATAVTLRRRR